MPYKANEPRRHKIPRARYKVRNWPAYDRALQQRGSLTVWVTPEALAAWHPPRTGGAQHQVALRDVLLDVALASLVKNRDLVPVWVFLPLSVLVPHSVIGRDRNPHDLARLHRTDPADDRELCDVLHGALHRWGCAPLRWRSVMGGTGEACTRQGPSVAREPKVRAFLE